MALAIHISSYISAGYTNPVRWDLIETGTGVKIDEHVESGPHGQVYNFSFTENIIDVIYTIKLYEETGGGIGQLIKAWDVSVSTSSIVEGRVIEIIVDGSEDYDPVDGASSVVIDELHDQSFQFIQRGIGHLRQEREIEFTWDNDTNTLALLDGNTFHEGDTFFAVIGAKIIINPAGTQAASRIYKDVVLITADTILTTLDFGKKLIVNGSLPVVTLTLPAVGDTIAKVPLFIESVGTTHHNVIIKAATGETITATGTTSNTFILGQAEKAEVINLDGVLYGFTDSQDIKRVGQFDWNYAGELLNRMWADGTIVLAADYPRLKKAMDAGNCGEVVTYATWAATQLVEGVVTAINKGYYALSADGLSIQLPDLRNKSFRALRYSDGTSDANRLSQGAGGYQHNDNKNHYHIQRIWADNPSLAYGVETTVPLNVEDITSSAVAKTELHRTAESGSEARPTNIGQIPLIIF